MNANPQSGFTLWELMITLLVAGILFGIGVPNMMEFQRNGLVIAATNELITGVLAARTEAVKRQVPVTLCASADPINAPACSITGAGTNGGFFVWVDENGNTDPASGAPIITDANDGNAVLDMNEPILRRTPPPGGTINVWANSGYISYGPNGFRRTATGSATLPVSWILICDDRGNRNTSGTVSTARVVRIDATGRAQVQQSVAEVAAALVIIRMSTPAAACP